MASATDILDIARHWIGCNESDGSYMKIVNAYNSHRPYARGYQLQPQDDWCTAFVSACAIMCSAYDIIPPEVGCEEQIKLFKKLGVWDEDESITPSSGDIIYFSWKDNGIGDNVLWSDHVGIVESVKNGVITTIEGNKNNRVERRTIAVNARYIRGYAHPHYNKEETPVDYETIAIDVISGKWGNGADRIELLTAAGYNAQRVQEIVNQMLNDGNYGKRSNVQIAREVIKGMWGNGAERKQKLTESGYDYYAIQQIVNNLLS